MESRLLLDVVIREGATVLELLSSKDETLLIRRDALLVLNLGLDVVDGVAGLHVESNRLAGERLDKDLHSTTETEDQVEGRLLLDVVIREGATVLELLSGKDETLLIRRDALLVLDLRLDVVDRVAGLDVERNGLAGERLDKDLHSTAETEDQVEGRLLLDVVVRESAAILELLSGKDQALLIGRNALLVLDLGLDVVDRVAGLDVEGDGLSGERLDEDLHSTAQAENEVERRLLLDVVVRESAAILELLSGKDQALLIRRNSLLVLDLGLDVVDRVAGLHVEGDGLSGEGFHKDLRKGPKERQDVSEQRPKQSSPDSDHERIPSGKANKRAQRSKAVGTPFAYGISLRITITKTEEAQAVDFGASLCFLPIQVRGTRRTW